MLVSKLDVDDVVAWLSGAVGDLTGAVLHVLAVNVHFTGALDGQAQSTITWRQEDREREDGREIEIERSIERSS